MRFKIRTLMIAVAAIAVLLLAVRFPPLVVTLFLAACAALAHGLWLAVRRFKRLPATAFGVAGSMLNLLCFVASMAGSPSIVVILSALPCLIGTAVVVGFGAAWCFASARDLKLSRRSLVLRWTVVAVISLAPVTMLFTQWPFRLAFLVSRPALERLADEVGAGAPLTSPRWAGVFVIVGSAVDAKTGNVGLITDPNPSGRTGFERYGALGRPGAGGAFYNFWSEMQLDENWRFAEED
jgi:hypothetical protein